MTELAPQYSPKDVEERLYQSWEKSGVFNADVDRSRTPYTIVIPPPNVTGILHMGHALNNTIQDILIRAKRMQGYNALWVPGTDHAGIATQNVVEKALAKEGKRRHDLGREAFVERVWKWKEQYGNTILYQLRRLGASCDWRRTRFTMDEGLSAAVLEVFVRLYQEGLIYRGNYIINWCPRCQTALADEEAPRVETQGKLYHVRYPVEGGGNVTYLEVATTRPETMLGDSAVAVHPADERYKGLVGRNVILPLVNRGIPIIANEMVDSEFGTGAVKVTPAHDSNDYRLGKKHGLPFFNIMTDDARITGALSPEAKVPAAYEGLDLFDARSKLIRDLEEQGFLGAIDEYAHNVGHCYRCNTIVEPRLSLQWFVRMKPLAEPALAAVKSGQIQFSPERWTKVYLIWMENIEDWCISRQIWWGHRLPVYYCARCVAGKQGDADKRGVIVSKTRPEKCPACGSTDIRQDEDVLDTWFSSWLWPFSTLGWPNQTSDLDYFYPTNTLVTAQEIIFFWVARMIMAGFHFMKRPPFTRVYIHGTVRDITGKKMSKSLGNVIDPLQIIEQVGTDALRYTLVTATAIGQDVFLSEERFQAGRYFANKLWNATRFVLAQPGWNDMPRGDQPFDPKSLTVADRWIQSRLQYAVERVTKAIDDFLFNEAATTIYDFLWHDYCDWYVEIAKIQIAQGKAKTTLAVLWQSLEQSLRLLHPVMPFITEDLWQRLWEKAGRKDADTIARAAWPKPDQSRIDPQAEQAIADLQAVVGAIRAMRNELHVPADARPAITLFADRKEALALFSEVEPIIQALAQTGEICVLAAAAQKPQDAAATVVGGIEVLLPLAGLIDPRKELERLEQKVQEQSKLLAGVDARLANAEFTSKAPPEILDGARSRQAELRDIVAKLKRYLETVRRMIR